MTRTLYAFTESAADPDVLVTVPLVLDEADLWQVAALAPLAEDDADDCAVTDRATGGVFIVGRFPCGADCDCALFAEPVR